MTVALVRLFRIELPFTAGICVILGQLLALGGVPDVSDLVLGFLSIFCISATALILNDYFDFEIDKINAPERPLPAGLVSRKEVVVWWFGLLAMLFDLGEEIAADAMDVEGDKLAGSRSLAIMIGPRNALMVSAAVFSAVIVISVLPFFFRWLDMIYLLPMALMDSIIIYSMYRLLKPGADRPRRFVKWIYLGGSFSILMFIVLRLLLA